MWRYALATSPDAAASSSHEAVLTWSTHSGKYAIAVDGAEVFHSVAKGSVLEHRWTWSHVGARAADAGEEGDGVALRVVACRKPPVRASKDFRCYEFLVGGRRFCDLPAHGGAPGDGDGWGFANEEPRDDGRLTSILDIVDPGWRARDGA